MKFNLKQMSDNKIFDDKGERKKKRSNKEEKLQSRICKYMKLAYPGVLFDCDTAAGLNLGMKWNVLKKLYRSEPGFPDFTIYAKTNERCGLKLELKKAGSDIYKKDGGLRKDEHLEQQYSVQQKLIAQGWDARFCIGFDQAKELIDAHMAKHKEQLKTIGPNLIVAVE
jgi:hypothetical protein